MDQPLHRELMYILQFPFLSDVNICNKFSQYIFFSDLDDSLFNCSQNHQSLNAHKSATMFLLVLGGCLWWAGRGSG